MPVIVNASDPHPFLPSLGDPAAIEMERALSQDIRPIEIAIINLMADKQATERQLATWLGNTVLQINLTFATTDDYVNGIRAGRESRNTPPEHIRKFYNGWSDIRHRKFDGLIVTGVNALKNTVAEEAIWPDVEKILEWSDSHVLCSLFLCWGAKAALRHYHGIESHKAERKLWGVYDHRIESDSAGILFGFPDRFNVPVSRWKSPLRSDIDACPRLETVAHSQESGPNIIAEPEPYGRRGGLFARRLYILNHPEYETGTLKAEYDRDSAANPGLRPPAHYFPDDDVSKKPLNSWRHTAHIYTNWIRMVYEATPFDLENIPVPLQR